MARKRGRPTAKYIRIFFYLFVAVYMVIGVLFIVIGVFATFRWEEFNEYLGQGFMFALFCIYAAGIIQVLFGIVGLAGGIKRHKKVLYAFAGAMLCLLFLKILFGFICLAYSLGLHVEEETKEQFMVDVRSYWLSDVSKDRIDHVQKEMFCCGSSGPKDYTDNPDEDLPPTCCEEGEGESEPCRLLVPKNKIHEFGCGTAMYNLLFEVGLTVALLLIFTILFEVCGVMITAMYIRLLDRIAKDKTLRAWRRDAGAPKKKKKKKKKGK